VRKLNVTIVGVVLTSLMATLGVTSPAYAQPAETAEVELTQAEQAAADTVSEPWSPPADAADGDAPEPNSPEDTWEPVDEGRLDPAPDAAARGVTPLGAPVGTVAGKPGLGELPWFGFQDFELWEKSSVRVNLANGNLLVKANDFTTAVPGFGLRHDRYYNGLSTVAGTLGGGWQSNNGANDVGVIDGGSYIDYFAVNGAKFRFTASGSAWAAPSGSNLSLTKDAGSTTARYVVESNKTAEKWKFSSSGWLTSTTDRNGIGETYTYNASNRVTAVTNTNGRGYSFTYDTSGRPATVSDTAGRTATYLYDSSNRLRRVTRSASGSISLVEAQYTYDSTGRLSTITYPASVSTAVLTIEYDTSHRVTKIKQQSGGTSSITVNTTFAYSAGQTVVTDPNAHAATHKIDSEGRVTEATDALGRKRSATWTTNSDVATATDAMATGNVSTYTYDGNNNETKAQLPTGAAASAAYAIGANCSAPNTGTAFQLKCSTDAAGNSRQYEYDTSGNLTKQTNTTGGGSQTEFEHTYENSSRTICGGFAGQVCSAKDGNGKVTTFAYDVDGDLISVTPPAPMGATTFAHDSIGRVTSTTNGNAHTTAYTYDFYDRNLTETYASSGTRTFTYYPNGLLSSDDAGTTPGTDDTISFNYDKLGRLTQHRLYSGFDHRYEYDAVGNMLSWEDDGGAGTTAYTYDAANQLTSIKEPGGTCPPSGNPAAGSGCILLQYDNNAQEIKRTYPGGAVIDTTRDSSGRPTRIAAKAAGGTTAVDVGYSYTFPGTSVDTDAVQTRTSHKEEGITAGAVTTYTYDLKNQLTKAEEKTGPSVTASWSYAYDGAGNRTQQLRSGATGAPAGTINYTYNNANQITSATGQSTTWTYDGAGQQTRRGFGGQLASYNDRLQASTIAGTAQTYLSQGNSNRRTSGATTFDTGALGLVKSQTGSATSFFTRSPDGTALGQRSATTTYFVTDHIGSVVGVFASTGTYAGGYAYSPFGETRATGTNAAVTANPLRYIGGELDSSGLYKLGSRYYDPTLGRFTQWDPTGQDPHYTYAGNDPINSADPSGNVAFLAPLALFAVKAIAARAGIGVAWNIARVAGGMGLRSLVNRSLGKATASQLYRMNGGVIRLGASRRFGSVESVNALRITDWHYYLSGYKY
jgi:RHS repeat-associated protein